MVGNHWEAYQENLVVFQTMSICTDPINEKKCTLKNDNWTSPAGTWAYPNLLESMMPTINKFTYPAVVAEQSKTLNVKSLRGGHIKFVQNN